LRNHIDFSFSSTLFKTAYFYSWWIIPTSLVLGLLYGFKNIIRELGLDKGFFMSLIFSIVTVSPMLISSALIGTIDKNLNFLLVLNNTAFAGFTEEFLFRGFLFGLLFRKEKWGFIPAALLGAFIFGFAHIYQGSTFSETMGVFIVTSLGAVWFSWLFIEWNNNLWIPIFLHALMNLSWILFNVSENALGGFYTNLFRVITIASTIVITIIYKKSKGLIIEKNNLISNPFII
jgi:hypothetical protein